MQRGVVVAAALALLATVAVPIVAALGPEAVAQPGPVRSQVGLVDPEQGRWHLRSEDGPPTSFFYGNPGDVPFLGDWDCDGIATPGLYRQSDGFVYLRNSNSQGIADIRFFFGNPGDVPLADDFDGDGCDTVSLYRPGEARFFIINKLGADEGGLGAADTEYLFGNPGDKPFAGDFDGDGTATVGLHRESTGRVYFRNSHSQGIADADFVFGDPKDRLVAGDWTGDGVDSPGVFRPSEARFYLRHSNTSGIADENFFFGEPPWLPVAGKLRAARVTVCHGGAELNVEPADLAEHLGHGDRLGPCTNPAPAAQAAGAVSLGTGGELACAAVAAGGRIDVALRVDGAPPLAGFHTLIGYDPAVLRVAAVDTDQLLATGPGSAVVGASDAPPDSDGTLRVAAVDPAGPAEAGTGVLATISFEAIGTGRSFLTVGPTFLGGAGLAPLGDTGGDALFDGAMFAAALVSGIDCPRQHPHSLLLGFVAGTSQPQRDATIREIGARTVAFLDQLDVYLLEAASGQPAEVVAATAQARPEVEFAEAAGIDDPDDHQTHPTDPGYRDSEQWALSNDGQPIAPDQFFPGAAPLAGTIDADLDAPQQWDLVTDCRGPAGALRVAVIDDGIDLTHPDLAANLDPNPLNHRSFTVGAAPAANVQHDPPDSHGTLVAGVIAADGNNPTDISGACWRANLMVMKFDGFTPSLLAALNYILTREAAGVDVRVVNYSYSGPFNPLVRAQVARLGARGIMFVVSAGNRGVNVDGPGGNEGIYRDLVNAAANEIEAGDLRLTAVTVGGRALAPGPVVAGDPDIDVNPGAADLVPFPANERFRDLDGDGVYDPGEPIYRSADAEIGPGDVRLGYVSAGGQQLPSLADAAEGGGPPGSCADMADNDAPANGLIDAADPACQVAAGDPDANANPGGPDLIAFPADHKHIDGNGDGLLAAMSGRAGNGHCVMDLANVLCVGASDNNDRPAADPAYARGLAEDGAAAGTCGDGLENGGADGRDLNDPDCYRPSVFSNFGPSVDLFAPGDDIRTLCNRAASAADLDGDGLADSCDATGNVYDPTNAEGAAGNPCNDNVDNDANTLTDREDPACYDPTPAQFFVPGLLGEDGGAVGTCTDGIDNGGADGIDTADPDCYWPQPAVLSTAFQPAASEDGAGANSCSDGVDNARPGATPVDPDILDGDCYTTPGLDHDGDGVGDGPAAVAAPLVAGPDNCITIRNAGQANADGDTRGDACDPEPNEANAMATTRTVIVDGTSFAAPYAAGVAAGCFAMFPLLSVAEVKAYLLRFADRVPALAGLSTSGGRLRWPCTYDLGDAPESYVTLGREGPPPSLLRCSGAANGPIHLDYGNEWLGADASGEQNANTPTMDQDAGPNLGGAATLGPCSDPVPPNNDGADERSHTFTPQPPWMPGQVVQVEFQVCSDHLRDTDGDGAVDAQVADAAGGRYRAGSADSRVYAHLWFDWGGDGSFAEAGDKTALVRAGAGPPGDVIDEVELPATAAPDTPPGDGCVQAQRSFTAVTALPPWYRWRLDYGEDVGDNTPALFLADAKLPVDDHLQIAVFGEVEDYKLKEVDRFEDSEAEVVISGPGIGQETLTLVGPTVIEVDITEVGDADGDGLDEVATEIVSMNLVGDSQAVGPVVLRVRDASRHPFQASTGVIEENFNATAGVLDLAPFVPSDTCPGSCTAASNFRVFFEIEVAGTVLHNEIPKEMETEIRHKPPNGDVYVDPDRIPLLTEDNLPSGFFLEAAQHVPHPGTGVVELRVDVAEGITGPAIPDTSFQLQGDIAENVAKGIPLTRILPATDPAVLGDEVVVFLDRPPGAGGAFMGLFCNDPSGDTVVVPQQPSTTEPTYFAEIELAENELVSCVWQFFRE